jgi:siroheme decarboxylase
MDELDRELLNVIQNDFPMVSAPFAELGRRLGIDETDALARIARLKDEHVIRQVSAIFDTRALGYRSSLVAMAVPKDRLERAAELINAHPGVSHNYRRNHEFNLWFTVAVPYTSDLQAHVDRLHEDAGATSTRVLQTLRMFKIGVDLDMVGDRSVTEKTAANGPDPKYLEAWKRGQAGDPGLSSRDIAIIRELQEDIELVPAPFAAMGERLGMTEQEVLDAAQGFVDRGYMRRFAAVLFHRHAGYTANAMAVWVVPEEKVGEYGPAMAAYRNVSHCYQRPIYEDWPYNLFSMIHGRSKEACEEVVQAIAADTGLTDRAVLYSSKEYKKVRVRYFTDDFYDWEREHLGVDTRPQLTQPA